jgi:hypothetical protein
MPKYLIERNIEGADQLDPATLRSISQKSCSILTEMGGGIQWIHSYVTKNKIYCVYIAKDEDMIREHALLGGFPIDTITEIKTVIDPCTGE